MADPRLASFLRIQPRVVDAVAKSAKALRARGEEIHVVGLRRRGDDDGDLGCEVVVDPVLGGVKKDFEPRDDRAARLWRLEDDGPPAFVELVETLAEEHEDADPDDFPGRASSEPHALLTAMLDGLAVALATRLEARVELLDTSSVPLDERERLELRAWAKG